MTSTSNPKTQKKLAQQRNRIGQLEHDRAAKLEHIGRLRRLLRNALDNAPGWREEAARETTPHQRRVQDEAWD
jgi:hypothetical protein